MATTTELAAGNIFLLPNGTFFVELIIFLIVLVVFWKVILPPLQKALDERDAKVRKTAQDSQQAEEKLKAAQAKYATALAEARGESAVVREDARAEGTRTLNELREQAHREADAISQRASEQMAEQRAQAVRDLRGHVGEFSVALAGRIIGAPLPADSNRSVTIARFLEEVDSSTPESAGSAQ
jgi:F-type H+-transporting ATPase subunit b